MGVKPKDLSFITKLHIIWSIIPACVSPLIHYDRKDID